jgi:UDP-N-acetylglucosamine 3-dehydrogenase
MNTLRVGVIGCGFFGGMHIEVLRDLANAELVAVSDQREDRLASYAAEGIQTFTDYRGLLDSDLDAVHICVPDARHTDVLKAAVAADKHVLVEKPLTDRAETAREVYELCRSYPRKVMVGHILRFNNNAVKAYEIISSGEIGEIVYVSSRRVSPVTGGQKYGTGSNLAIHSCVHDIDLARWLVRDELGSVYAKTRHKRLAQLGVPAGDVVLALHEFRNGVVFSQENAWVLSPSYPVYVDGRMEVMGDAGSVHIDFFSHGLKVYRGEEMEHPDMQHWPLLLGRRNGDLREEIRHFVEAVLEDGELRVTARDGYAAVVAAERMQESMASGGVVSVEDID